MICLTVKCCALFDRKKCSSANGLAENMAKNIMYCSAAVRSNSAMFTVWN